MTDSTDSTDSDNWWDVDLTGETVANVREQSTYDLVLEFESGRVLHVDSAKWWVEDPDT